MTGRGKVFVVDDDPEVRKSLVRLIGVAGWDVEALASAGAFLERAPHDGPACLVLDIRMPGVSGLDLQRKLDLEGTAIPIIFMTGHGDIPMGVNAMKDGAVDFLPKPFEDEALLDAIRRAIERDRRDRLERGHTEQIQARVGSLTGREREVFAHVARGLPNKLIAAELGITEKTVKVHRARVMTKMQAGSLAELVRLAQSIEHRP